MKTSLKLTTMTVLLFALTGACAGGPDLEPESGEAALAAQTGDGPSAGARGPGRFAGGRLAALTETLNLTEEQAAQVQALFAEQAPARQGGRRDRAAFAQARAEMHARLLAILTPEQRATLEQLPIERRLQRLTERLALNEQQAAQVRAILQESVAQAQQLRAQGPDARDAHLALRTQTRERIGAVLTPEQRSRFEQASDGERGGGRGGHGRSHGRGGRPGFGDPRHLDGAGPADAPANDADAL